MVIGFATDLARTTYPSLTKEFLYGVPVVLTLVPPLLLAVSNATRGGLIGQLAYLDYHELPLERLTNFVQSVHAVQPDTELFDLTKRIVQLLQSAGRVMLMSRLRMPGRHIP